jgi:hypothetical protein
VNRFIAAAICSSGVIVSQASMVVQRAVRPVVHEAAEVAQEVVHERPVERVALKGCFARQVQLLHAICGGEQVRDVVGGVLDRLACVLRGPERPQHHPHQPLELELGTFAGRVPQPGRERRSPRFGDRVDRARSFSDGFLPSGGQPQPHQALGLLVHLTFGARVEIMHVHPHLFGQIVHGPLAHREVTEQRVAGGGELMERIVVVHALTVLRSGVYKCSEPEHTVPGHHEEPP